MGVKIFLLLFISAMFFQQAMAAGIAVIGNFSSDPNITTAELKKIYLENGVRVSGGIFIQPIDYHEDNELRDEFYRKLLEKNRAQLKAYWARRVFTGKGTPPKSFSNLKEAREFLQNSKSPYVLYLKESEVEKNETVLLKIVE